MVELILIVESIRQVRLTDGRKLFSEKKTVILSDLAQTQQGRERTGKKKCIRNTCRDSTIKTSLRSSSQITTVSSVCVCVRAQLHISHDGIALILKINP